MPAPASGALPHQTPRDVEMDFTWQELMAITELQDFEMPGESPFDSTVCHAHDAFGITPPPTELHPFGCGANPEVVFDQPYTEVTVGGIQACQRTGTDVEDLCEHLGTGMGSSLLNNPPVQPPLLGPLEHISLGDPKTDGKGNSQCQKCPMLGQCLRSSTHKKATDDLGSGLSLSTGSSSTLLSNAVTFEPACLGREASQGYSDDEPLKMDTMVEQSSMRVNQYYQQPGNLYPYPVQPHSYFLNPHSPPQIQQGLQLHQIFPPAKNGFHLDSTILPQSAPHTEAFIKPRAAPTPQTGAEPMGRDERQALALHIPFPLEQIINLPVDDFNELLARHALNEPQLALVRDIRRRGKNKVAAQNCRKRKLESIVLLEDELGRLRVRHEQLAREHVDFQSSLALARCRLSELCTKVSSWLQDHDRCPYSMDHFSFQHTGDGSVHLGPCGVGD
ncbi:transcription factor NF-E2 45 kDa subunit-like [Megalops cyprinoides]|uniref:transcription factor NF-E2 45 kDa subunit-like n=1 Tax=Megalops cyprinoides TaxID=118141 RepID=UPI0018656A41|nr:transcription factor NF-E2 45 kDa subunit-like [Megalops cyprinoides]